MTKQHHTVQTRYTYQPGQRQRPPKNQQGQARESSSPALLLQRAMADPTHLTPAELQRLQRMVGNKNVQRLLAKGPAAPALQRQLAQHNHNCGCALCRGGVQRMLDLKQHPLTGRADVLQKQDDDDDLDLSEFFKTEEEKEEEKAQALLEVYQTMLPGMSKFAKRKGDVKDFKGSDLKGVSKALSLPRLPDGSLSPEAISIMDALQAEESQGYIDKSRQGGIVNAPTDKTGIKNLKKKLKTYDLNKVTGKTRLPELMNLINPVKSKEPERHMVTPVTVAGITMNVYHSNADVNFKPRLKLFEGAIKKIQAAGFTLPSTMLIHLPKYGRTIDAQTLCESGSTPRAVFNPPNFIHLSPAVVGNPIDTTLGESYKNLSTELDPEGPATVIHEMGHMMHYHSSPSNFYGLHGAGFTQDGDRISAKVSGYANGAPREFVAEVFMGLVYGRTFDDEILEMYTAYGGPISAKITSNIERIKKKQGKKK